MISALVFGVVSGIAVGSFFNINIVYFCAEVAVTLAIFVYRFLIPKSQRKAITLLIIFLFSFSLGLGRMMISDLYKSSVLENFLDKKVVVEGVIVEEPDIRETNTKLTIRVEKVESEVTNEKVLVTVPIYPEYKYGDRVRGKVTLKEPKEIESEDGRTFDYGGYLRVRGIWYTSSFTTLEFLSSNEGNKVKSVLFKTKKAFTNSISSVLPEPESSLLLGLLIGSKQSLGKEILTEFRRTGTSHIVVLSGYNIAIVAESVMNFLKFLPKNVSFGFGSLAIILFTILSGAGASGVRAAIMVLVALFAKHSNREYNTAKILGLTIILMLAPNPLLLVFDPSFQLSVLATIGLVFVSPIVSPYFSKLPERFGNFVNLREIVSTTIATQITVLPFLIYSTGLVSFVSLPVNVLILSTIPITMLLGFITGVLGFINFYLSIVPAFLTYLLLWYQLKIVHTGSNFPLGVINLPVFSEIYLILVYIVIFSILYFIKNKQI